MTTSESKADFFYKTNRFESIRITNRIDSNRELECSIPGPSQQQTRSAAACGGWMGQTDGRTDGHAKVT